MPTVFTKIIRGEIPGRFVWRDERCVGFLSINPLRPGHTLVVPIEEVDHWLDLDPDLTRHLITVSQQIGQALDRAYNPTRVGLMIAGLEVPHVHIHVVPIWGFPDLDFANAERDPDPQALSAAADEVRKALRELGFKQVAE
jgi:histidine triad (HIT) family protein